MWSQQGDYEKNVEVCQFKIFTACEKTIWLSDIVA